MSSIDNDDPASRVLAHEGTPELAAAFSLYSSLTSLAAKNCSGDIRRDAERVTRSLMTLVAVAHGEGVTHTRAALYRDVRAHCAKVSVLLLVLRSTTGIAAPTIDAMQAELRIIAARVYREIEETVAFGESLTPNSKPTGAEVDDEQLAGKARSASDTDEAQTSATASVSSAPASSGIAKEPLPNDARKNGKPAVPTTRSEDAPAGPSRPKPGTRH